MFRSYKLLFRLVVLLLLVGGGVALGIWLTHPGWTEEEVQTSILTTLERETPESFLITGSVTINAEAEVSNTRWFFPIVVPPVSLGYHHVHRAAAGTGIVRVRRAHAYGRAHSCSG
ncbi:MAG: hypothetical protein AAGJ10_02200 [Bacteroidota bacterium]